MREEPIPMPAEQERESRVAELQQMLSAPSDGYSAGQWCEAANDLLAELQAAQEREADIHTALAESNVPRSAGVDEPLYSDAYRVRLLGAELRLAQENIRVREESQIPVIPRGAQAKMDRLESELRAAQERERALIGRLLCRIGFHAWKTLDWGIVGCNCRRCGKERDD